MLEQGDPRGFLHLYETEPLRRALQRVLPTSSVLAERPILADAGHLEELDSVLNVERLYWQKANRKRWQVYVKCLKPYHAAVRAGRDWNRLELLAQHDRLVRAAIRFLPATPITEAVEQRILHCCREEILKGNPAWNPAWFPPVRLLRHFPAAGHKGRRTQRPA
jgi:hypothetical protein